MIIGHSVLPVPAKHAAEVAARTIEISSAHAGTDAAGGVAKPTAHAASAVTGGILIPAAHAGRIASDPLFPYGGKKKGVSVDAFGQPWIGIMVEAAANEICA